MYRCKLLFILAVDFLPYIQGNYLRELEGGLIGPRGLPSDLAVGVLTVFRAERRRVRRVVLLSNGSTPPKTNVPRHPSSFHLSIVGLVLPFSVEHASSRRDTPAFMPHYHCFETRHGGPMSFFIALLLAARFAEPARRRARKSRGAIPQKAAVPLASPLRDGGPSSFLHKKLSLNLKAALECLVNVALDIGRDRENSGLSTIKGGP